MSAPSAFLEGLNPPQRAAVLHEGGPLVVFAGAGSGKTRVITHRIARLVHERSVPPYRVLAVTFTNKAAGEMRERLGKLIPAGAKDLWVGTFHATCARLLRRYAEPIGLQRDFLIYDDGDARALVTRVMRDLGLDESRYPPKRLAAAIDRAKQDAHGPDDLPRNDPFQEIAARVYAAYEERLVKAGALDFGDLVFRLVRALEADESLRETVAGRFQHVLVDEFQDTNHVQLRLVRALASVHGNLVVVGDDDQSIYRWRGADRRNILEFRRAFPAASVVKLEQNYRSTKRILRVAHAVISRSNEREPKELWTDNVDGAKVVVVRCENERDESRMVAKAVGELVAQGRRLDDVAVLYRTHAQSRVLEDALRADNVPYVVIGGMRFYDRAEIKDLLAYLRIVQNPADDVSVLRVLNVPARGIGKTTITRVLDAAMAEGTGVFDVLARAAELEGLGAAVAKKVASFVELVTGLRARVSATSLDNFVRDVAVESGYIDALKAEDSPEADARLENLNELFGAVDELVAGADPVSLGDFLERVTLASDADASGDGERLTLMTVHAAKGLEFPVVLVPGLEENLFPFRSESDADPLALDEERRLAYVAFTRARERLVLSHVGTRRIFGEARVAMPSRFLDELPSADLERVGLPTPAWANPGGGGRGSYGGYGAGSTNAYGAGSYGSGSYGSGSYGSGSYGSGSYRARTGGGGSQQPSHDPLADVPRRAAPNVGGAGGSSRRGELSLDRSEANDEQGLHLGMRVRHARFGVGRVRAVMPGVPARVEVDFPGVGTKRITANFLEPA